MSPQHDKKAPDTLAPKPGEPHYVIPAETYTRPTPRNDAPARSFWARIDHPFVVGFVLTLGGLAAIVLGLAISNLSTVIRARKLMREKAKALSGEAVASAAIIGSLPPVVATLISITAPDYMRPLFTDPRGHLMLMAGAFWMTIGVLSMRKMINFKM